MARLDNDTRCIIDAAIEAHTTVGTLIYHAEQGHSDEWIVWNALHAQKVDICGLYDLGIDDRHIGRAGVSALRNVRARLEES